MNATKTRVKDLKVGNRVLVSFAGIVGNYEAEVIGFDGCEIPCPFFQVYKPIKRIFPAHHEFTLIRKLS